ncbi:TPA: hypothetical protein HA231_01515 [Candidatus Woesearchaeota archaeon]|nr:hypothetical protein [Candidatus Woesearchaeota archaeon]
MVGLDETLGWDEQYGEARRLMGIAVQTMGESPRLQNALFKAWIQHDITYPGQDITSGNPVIVSGNNGDYFFISTQPNQSS